VRVDGQEPDMRRERWAGGRLVAKSIFIKDTKRRFGNCARKATELTPGGLLRVPTSELRASGVVTLSDQARGEAISAARTDSGGDAGRGLPLHHGVEAMKMGGKAERRERGGTKRLRTAGKTAMNRCRPPGDRKPCIARSRRRRGR
jgi:hypothetical protein